ncbi:DNA-directed RNA polymerase subunit omega [Acholeplasma granularum]|uniref:DNA-directed RNA polymerase subunit omega n=1 Tax=Acholeplasma granularum TaxID=264635 RepID=UPI0004BC5E7E|nr:DNA-directed RNA polymerase subunit omega [Acholeplasma granularum]
MKKEKHGLNYPTIDKLLGQIDSKYKLVYAASKVAHMIEQEKLDVKDSKSVTSVGKALEEIANGKVSITFVE